MRWTKQSFALFRRSPAMFGFLLVLFWGVNALVYQPFYFNVPVTVFLMGSLFNGLRAVDHNSGNCWAEWFALIRATFLDLASLARDAFLFYVFVGAILVALTIFTVSISEYEKMASEAKPVIVHLPWFIILGVKNGWSSDIIGLFMPISAPVVFLTMAFGNHLLLHANTGFRAFVINPSVSTVSMFMMALSYLVQDLFQARPELWIGITSILGSGLAFIWFGTWWYLWFREMFEGTKENAKATQKSTVSALAHSPS